MTHSRRRTFRILVLFFGAFLVTSCASAPGNPHDDWVLMPESTEKSMGESYAKQLENKVGLYESDTFARYVDNVGSRVAVYSERSDLDYKFGILDVFQINALALPGGYIYTTRGLLKSVETEAELAGVLAHEIAHVAAYHAVKRQQWSVLSMISAAAAASQAGGRGAGASLMARQMLIRGYTRSSEDQADRLGLKYLANAGYDPRGLINFLQTLLDVHNEIPQRDILFMRTHPFLTDRIRRANNRLPQYRDLLNDTPLVGQARYKRHKRQYLYQPREQVFLKTFERFFEAYREQEPAELRELMSPKFHLGDEDSPDTSADFMATLEGRIQRSRKIEYDKRLMKLDVGDTDAVVVYEYTSRRWAHGEPEPTITDGVQEMVWRRDEDQWRLTRLR